MQKTNLLLLFLLLFSHSFIVNAQSERYKNDSIKKAQKLLMDRLHKEGKEYSNKIKAEILLEEDSIVRNSEFIFECQEVNRSTKFYKVDNEEVRYTSALVKITKVYKGAEYLKEGTVELICKSPMIGGHVIFPSSEHWSMVFCKKSNCNALFVGADNRIIVEYTSFDKRTLDPSAFFEQSGTGLFNISNPTYSGFCQLEFNTILSTRSYFRNKYNLIGRKPLKQNISLLKTKSSEDLPSNGTYFTTDQERKEFNRKMVIQKKLMDSISDSNIQKKKREGQSIKK